MNEETANRLIEINNDFYRNHARSFSETREHPWQGWHRCLEMLRKAENEREAGGASFNFKRFSVFDLACGNQRFKTFLTGELPEAEITYYAVDNCDALVPSPPDSYYQNLDVLRALQKGLCLSEQLEAPVCDLSVSFGFMHHVPLKEYREEVLRSLIRQTRPGGYVIVTFWQFLKDKALKEKASATHKRALQELELNTLDENDCLIGWKDTPGLYRYCHHFSDGEIEQLAGTAANEASLISRFTADGKTNDMNRYLIWRVLY